MRDIIQNPYLATKQRQLSLLKDDLAWDVALPPEQRAAYNKRIAQLQTLIDKERNWMPSQKVIDEMLALERESYEAGKFMWGANIENVKSLAERPGGGTYTPITDKALQEKSNKANKRLYEMADKYRIPLEGLTDLRRWGLLNAETGRYIGGIGQRA